MLFPRNIISPKIIFKLVLEKKLKKNKVMTISQISKKYNISEHVLLTFLCRAEFAKYRLKTRRIQIIINEYTENLIKEKAKEKKRHIRNSVFY